MDDPRRALAFEIFQTAFEHQLRGDLDLAADMYRRSIEVHPTAEAYTFLGWTYRYQGRLDEAIAECKKAIDVDPGFGNPYNDIGAYLIEQGKYQEAIPWLERATQAARYEAYHYPWYNLGRAYAGLEMFSKARSCFARSLEIEPGYTLAREALERLRVLVQ